MEAKRNERSIHVKMMKFADESNPSRAEHHSATLVRYTRLEQAGWAAFEQTITRFVDGLEVIRVTSYCTGYRRENSSLGISSRSHPNIQTLKQLGLQDEHLVGISTSTQEGKKRIQVSDWLALAAAITNNTGNLSDNANRGIAHYKEYRKTTCRNFFFATLFGLICAVWANEIRYGFKNSNSFQSLSLQLTTVSRLLVCSSPLPLTCYQMVSTAIALYYLWQYYHAELCVMRLKGCKIAPGRSWEINSSSLSCLPANPSRPPLVNPSLL
eukprot:762947-Hanusia_phi.AAC.11